MNCWMRELSQGSYLLVISTCFLLVLQTGTTQTVETTTKPGNTEGRRDAGEGRIPPPERNNNVGTSVVVAVDRGVSSSVHHACGESWCSSFSDNELLALEAIRSLHRQIDDDKDGKIDFDESDEFLREELKYEGDYENRMRKFHRNDDNHISVRELWDSWVRSEVYNWTISDTIEWLNVCVGLPQYSQTFIENSLNGSFLPRLAINHQHLLSSTVGIKDLIHRQKIALKAQDVVLFGSPKDHGNRTKDSILTTLLALALIVCWCVYCRYKLSQRDLNKMIKDMESLSKAEQALMDLQKELEIARILQQEKASEAQFQGQSLDDGIPSSEEITRLKGEVEVLRNELQRAEVELQDKCWVPPPALQHWLQLTYELELKAYNRKKQSAEKQLKQAKDACDKLKKKRSSLMGAFVSTHGRSIDDVDKAILEARAALTEITSELQERMHRWKQIELLVNCPIMNNPGLSYLETVLRGIGRGTSYAGSVISNSQDDIDDDGASSIYCPSAVQKLVSTSTFMMFPGHEIPRYQQQHSSSAHEDGIMDGHSRRMSQHVQQQQLIQPQPTAVSTTTPSSSCSSPPLPANCFRVKSGSVDSGTPDSTVSAPATGSIIQMPIMRSKSVSSMISLRERAVSRECSSKESSTGEEEVSTETSEIMTSSGRDRRVTFGIRTDHRDPLSSCVNQARHQFAKEKREEGKACESGNRREIRPESSPALPKSPVSLVPVGDDRNLKKDSIENIRIWKVLSKNLRPPRNNKLDDHHLQAHYPMPLDDRSNDEKRREPALFSWSRCHLLKSPWKLYYPRSRQLHHHHHHHPHQQSNHLQQNHNQHHQLHQAVKERLRVHVGHDG